MIDIGHPRIDFGNIESGLLDQATVPKLLTLLPPIAEAPISDLDLCATHTQRFIEGWKQISKRGLLEAHDAAEYLVEFGISPIADASRLVLKNSLTPTWHVAAWGDGLRLEPHVLVPRYKLPQRAFRGKYYGIKGLESSSSEYYKLVRLGQAQA